MNKQSKVQSLGEEIANAISHGIGALFGIAALVLMLIKSNDGYDIFGSLVFGISMILLYTMSCLYHAFKKDTLVKRIFKRFDHISIYVLIGGTFAPLFIIAIDKPLGWIYLVLQWAIISVGIMFKAVKINRFQVMHVIIFLGLGWSGLTLAPTLIETYPNVFYLILSGGIFYSVGVFFYATRFFKYSHFVWHIFVLLGTVSHFFAIYLYIL
jgi:hemolysin III